MRRNRRKWVAAMVAALAVCLAGCSRAEPAKVPAPPNPVPAFDGVARSQIITSTALRIDPGPDALALFQRVVECYPTPSWFRPEVSAEVRAGQRSATFDNGTSGSGAAVVLRVPLWSTLEIEREREREAGRRQKIAGTVGKFVEALVQYRLTDREIEIWRGVEARSAKRVAVGVAETAEQLEAVKQVAKLESKRVAELAQIVTARIELVGMCTADRASGLNQYLRRFNSLEPGHRADGVD